MNILTYFFTRNAPGELTDDAFEKSEILRKQYETVASIPREEYKVKEGAFRVKK